MVFPVAAAVVAEARGGSDLTLPPLRDGPLPLQTLFGEGTKSVASPQGGEAAPQSRAIARDEVPLTFTKPLLTSAPVVRQTAHA